MASAAHDVGGRGRAGRARADPGANADAAIDAGAGAGAVQRLDVGCPATPESWQGRPGSWGAVGHGDRTVDLLRSRRPSAPAAPVTRRRGRRCSMGASCESLADPVVLWGAVIARLACCGSEGQARRRPGDSEARPALQHGGQLRQAMRTHDATDVVRRGPAAAPQRVHNARLAERLHLRVHSACRCVWTPAVAAAGAGSARPARLSAAASGTGNSPHPANS